MSRILSILAIVVILTQSFMIGVQAVGFAVFQDEIVQNACEKRYEAINLCSGKCYFVKMAESSESSGSFTFEWLLGFSYVEAFSKLSLPDFPSPYFLKKAAFHYKFLYSACFKQPPYHPPTFC